jgi:6-phosphogluconate dehydrogenase
MEIGMVGLGRMGLNMSVRLARGGHRVVGTDRGAEAVREAERRGVVGADSLEDLVARLSAPRVVWLMIPVGPPVDEAVAALAGRLGAGDVVVDGGNSHYTDSVRRARALAERGIGFVDCGTSGGVWGLANGYCLMVGGAADPVARLAPAFQTLAPPEGWAHVGGPGAGHFVKMVHNAIEYGLLQAYAEGFEILHDSDYRLDLGRITHLWNQGSVVRSWLLELAERAFAENPTLAGIGDAVDDTGMGRWAAEECVARAIPAPVLLHSLLARFRSRQEESFAGQVVAALRQQFGGHAVHKE